ncbi:hypothetical protein B0H14DRAFT_2625669 [Mycena olivaceomarginata]|nr:hypothetical protein B0H14DRAFT_2625669 [Mycena olivaceomarginata]
MPIRNLGSDVVGPATFDQEGYRSNCRISLMSDQGKTVGRTRGDEIDGPTASLLLWKMVAQNMISRCRALLSLQPIKQVDVEALDARILTKTHGILARAAARDRGHGSTAPVARVPCPFRRPLSHLDDGTATARVPTNFKKSIRIPTMTRTSAIFWTPTKNFKHPPDELPESFAASIFVLEEDIGSSEVNDELEWYPVGGYAEEDIKVPPSEYQHPHGVSEEGPVDSCEEYLITDRISGFRRALDELKYLAACHYVGSGDCREYSSRTSTRFDERIKWICRITVPDALDIDLRQLEPKSTTNWSGTLRENTMRISIPSVERVFDSDLNPETDTDTQISSIADDGISHAELYSLRPPMQK